MEKVKSLMIAYVVQKFEYEIAKLKATGGMRDVILPYTLTDVYCKYSKKYVESLYSEGLDVIEAGKDSKDVYVQYQHCVFLENLAFLSQIVGFFCLYP